MLDLEPTRRPAINEILDKLAIVSRLTMDIS